MAGKYAHSIIHFPEVVDNDWISNNFINSRGGSFIAPVTNAVTEFMPVKRGNLTNSVFSPSIENEPAILVCRKIFIDNGVRYGVIDCSIRTVKYNYTTTPDLLVMDRTYTITAGNGGSDGTDPSVNVAEADTGVLFRIIDQDSYNKTITFISA